MDSIYIYIYIYAWLVCGSVCEYRQQKWMVGWIDIYKNGWMDIKNRWMVGCLERKTWMVARIKK